MIFIETYKKGHISELGMIKDSDAILRFFPKIIYANINLFIFTDLYLVNSLSKSFSAISIADPLDKECTAAKQM